MAKSKKMRKRLAWVLIVCVMLSAFPVQALAAQDSKLSAPKFTEGRVTPPTLVSSAAGGSSLMGFAPMALGEPVVTVHNDTYTDASPHQVSLNQSNYSLTLDVNPDSFSGTPRLTVSIPKNITLSSYPTASNPTLASYIQSVSTRTGEDGSTTLDYTFYEGISALGFNISLLPTYKLKTGQTFTVTAALYDGETEMGTASDAITVVSNPTLANNAYNILYSDAENQKVNLTDAEYYYVKAVTGFRANYNIRYEYDSLTLTVPIPASATPGYYEGETFTPLTPGVARSIANGTVTYRTDLTFTTQGGVTFGTAGTGYGLVYELDAAHGLTSSTDYRVYYLYDSAMGSIWFRFPGDTAAGIVTPGCAAKITGEAGEDSYILLDYYGVAGLSSYTVSYQFRDYNINDYIIPYMTVVSSPINLGSALMPTPDRTYIVGGIVNLTGEVLTDVEVEYSGGYNDGVQPLSPDLHCHKLEFRLSTTGTAPTTATVTYSYYDASAGVVVSGVRALMTVSDKILALEEQDYFTGFSVVYDRVGISSSSSSPVYTVDAYCYNAGRLESGTRYMYAKVLQAQTSTETFEGLFTKTAVQSLTLCTTLAISPYYFYLNGTTNGMDKGMTYSFRFSPSYNGAVKNLCFYFLLPQGYEFQSYTPPSNWGVASTAYTISTRTITVGADTELGLGGYSYIAEAGDYTLCTVRYTDGIEHRAVDTHYVYFALGPTVDTAQVKTGMRIPTIFCMSTESETFPFYEYNNYRLADLLDFDADGNTAETFSRYYSMPTATQNAAKVITLYGSLTSSYESGSGTSKAYQYNSTGTYRFTIHNGLDSGNTAVNAVIRIAVPSAGTGIAAALCSEAVLEGEFLSGAAVTYSTDGGENYGELPADLRSVTHVRVVTDAESVLASGEAAYILLPFSAAYGTAASSSSTAKFTGSISYSLYRGEELASTPSSSVPDCTIGTAPVRVSGTVFRDYDSDGVRGANEQNNGKSYNVRLYQGTYTGGAAGLVLMGSTNTNTTTGSFSFANVYQPGDYTLAVNVESTEVLNDYSGAWIRDGNFVYLSFSIRDSVTEVNTELPLRAPRVLWLNYYSCFLYNNATKKLIATVLPALEEEETLVYESSDPLVVSVAGDGTLTYVSDGSAVVTASVPGFGGGEQVVASCTVYARNASYSVTLHAGEGVTLNAGEYNLSSGTYVRSYTAGNTVSLPSASLLANSDPTYYFGGWYGNEELTGSAVSSVGTYDYGDKEYFAKWIRYETTYETAPGVWAYGTFSAASMGVYNGGTIKLLGDVTFFAEMYYKSITLKTDGTPRTLTLTGRLASIQGTLAVDDEKLTIQGIGTGGAVLEVSSSGTLTIRAGTVRAVHAYPILIHSGTANILGGTISGSTFGAVGNIGGTVNISGGTITSPAFAAVENVMGTLRLSGGAILSPGGNGVRNGADAVLYLSGTPSIQSSGEEIYQSAIGTVYGNDGAATPSYYSGAAIDVRCGWTPKTLGDVVAVGASDAGLFTATNAGGYGTKLDSGNIVLAKHVYAGQQASAPTASDKSISSVLLEEQLISGQTVEYAYGETAEHPDSAWQLSTLFTGLEDGTTYYFFARVKETAYVLPGIVSEPSAITTKIILSATAVMAGYTYGGTVSTPSVSSNPGDAAVSYYYGTENTNSGGTPWTGIQPITLDTGTYYLYAVIAESENYTDCTTAAVAFTVGKADYASTARMAGYTYGETVSTPSVSSNPGDAAVSYYYGTENTNSGGTPWTGISPTTLDAGTYYLYAVIAESQNHKSATTAPAEFRVEQKTVPVLWTQSAEPYLYDGTAQGRSITAQYTDAEGNSVQLEVRLTRGGVSTPFRDAGTYTATAFMIAQDDNYLLTNTTVSYTMGKAPLSADMIADIAAVIYNGVAHTPTPTVTGAVPGAVTAADYSVGFSDNIRAGTATVTITATEDGNYTGSASKTFTIQRRALRADIIAVVPEQTYTGQAVEPSVTLRDGALGTIPAAQYTVAYQANREAGTATVTVTALAAGNYTGSFTFDFQINPAPISGRLLLPDTAEVGDRVEADISGVLPASAGGSLRWQWLRDGEAISGETSAAYTMTDQDAGAVLTVKVSGTGDYSGSITSGGCSVLAGVSEANAGSDVESISNEKLPVEAGGRASSFPWWVLVLLLMAIACVNITVRKIRKAKAKR